MSGRDQWELLPLKQYLDRHLCQHKYRQLDEEERRMLHRLYAVSRFHACREGDRNADQASKSMLLMRIVLQLSAIVGTTCGAFADEWFEASMAHLRDALTQHRVDVDDDEGIMAIAPIVNREDRIRTIRARESQIPRLTTNARAARPKRLRDSEADDPVGDDDMVDLPIVAPVLDQPQPITIDDDDDDDVSMVPPDSAAQPSSDPAEPSLADAPAAALREVSFASLVAGGDHRRRRNPSKAAQHHSEPSSRARAVRRRLASAGESDDDDDQVMERLTVQREPPAAVAVWPVRRTCRWAALTASFSAAAGVLAADDAVAPLSLLIAPYSLLPFVLQMVGAGLKPQRPGVHLTASHSLFGVRSADAPEERINRLWVDWRASSAVRQLRPDVGPPPSGTTTETCLHRSPMDPVASTLLIPRGDAVPVRHLNQLLLFATAGRRGVREVLQLERGASKARAVGSYLLARAGLPADHVGAVVEWLMRGSGVGGTNPVVAAVTLCMMTASLARERLCAHGISVQKALAAMKTQLRRCHGMPDDHYLAVWDEQCSQIVVSD
jgi:hypothetical protein